MNDPEMNMDTETPLLLRKYPNGGWVIEKHDGSFMGRMPMAIGSYTTPEDMLAALRAGLCGGAK